MTLHIKAKDLALERCLDSLDNLVEMSHELNIRLVVENSSSTTYRVPLEELLSRDLDFNLDVREFDAIEHSGANVFSSDVTALNSGTTSSSFGVSTVSGGAILVFKTPASSAEQGTVNYLTCAVHYRKNVE